MSDHVAEEKSMTPEKQSVFAQLLFGKYEESMLRLHSARKARYEAEVEMMNLQETIQLLKWRIDAQAAHEQRLLDDQENDRVRAERETAAYERGLERDR